MNNNNKISKYKISTSYLVLSILFIIFPMGLKSIGITIENYTVTVEILLSLYIASLHLLFSLYLYPSYSQSTTLSQTPTSLKIQRALFGFVIGTLIFYFISILYGAPFFTSIFRTLCFGLLISSMTAVPSAIILGSNPQNWKDLYFYPSHNSIFDTCCTIVVLCSLFGAWIGAFAIPLDWDRPWQVWPISCVYSSLLGHFVGLISSTVYCLLYSDNSTNSLVSKHNK
ncbi:phosphatidylinositol glycan [Tieghemostelium lacteum]|uniref:Phosphatidylinositol glycan n=1 Tax=Tieghemostelium lacteum TaxID=361077 RepID=A0A151ZK65_TIELA|nr:phosphatidylinositol glycan [Tieghemostelium lacteum]|eukprot:KYQ94299.1 phosphatidylinositol glycan [Tieghemostelium lacteum]